MKQRLVAMVKDTLMSHAPGKEFNERVRRLLEKVPVVSFELHQKKEKSGLRRFPESMPFPSCLRSYLEYIGDDMGFKKIKVYDRDWRLDTTYVFLMGTTGTAFRLSWKPGWYLGNLNLTLISEDPLAPYNRGLELVGYTYEIIQKENRRSEENYFRKRIKYSIQ